MSPADAASLRLEAIKTALTVAAGIGAGITLLLALRRQRFTEEDAQEQRITELYVAAAEQLGSDKAAVRLAGLYALERLGQDNPKLRQTVIDVICAYLRMPYTPPVEVLRGDAERSPEHLAIDAPEPDPKPQSERRQELQVRLTAQRLIRDHTRDTDPEPGPKPQFGRLRDRQERLALQRLIRDLTRMRDLAGDTRPAAYWRGPGNERMTLDLTGAVLVDFDLHDCQPGPVTLSRAQFHGYANLGAAQFHWNVDLSWAQFHGYANLDSVQFYGNADLRAAQFHGYANLSVAQFHEYANLGAAQFHGNADLNWAQFHGNATLDSAQFHGNANLRAAQFHGEVQMTREQFHREADLREARVSTRVTLPEGWAAVPTPGDKLLRVVAVQAPDETGRQAPGGLAGSP